MDLTSDQRQVIDDEVRVWMETERMFTAYEISRAVKGKGIRLRHREMKTYIHRSIASRRSRSYTRTLVDVGAPEQAWLYHPLTKNPHQFRALQRDGSNVAGTHTDESLNSPQYKPRNPVSLADDDGATFASGDDGVYGCDVNGNLLLPAAELEKVGIKGNETVHVYSDPKKQTVDIGKPENVQDVAAEAQQTLSNGDLLVYHETLEFVDLDWLPCYKIEVEGNTLRIAEQL